MIAPAPLLRLLDGSRVVRTRDGIKATLAALMPGVAVVSHPGKLDINDYVAKAIVPAPGVAVGYTRLRQAADLAGTWSDVVDWVAYLVVDDLVDRGPPVVTHPRELVAHAIGGRILAALRDPALMCWGQLGVEPPGQDPGPALVPLFTAQADRNMTGVYAVTWTQALANDGEPWFDGPIPPAHGVGGPDGDAAGLPGAAAGDDEVVFDLPPGEEDSYPPELLAYVRRGGPLPGAGP